MIETSFGNFSLEKAADFLPFEGFSTSTVPTRQCTRLFPVEPMAIGTNLVESLGSYIADLACSHSVSAASLMDRELTPRMNLLTCDYRQKYRSQAKPAFGHWRGINGPGEITERTVDALQIATGAENLECLTTLRLGWYIAPKHHYSWRRWCAACLNEFRVSGRPFEPLVWSISGVSVCPKHQVLLEELCPHCLRRSFPLQRFSRPGYCPYCSTWLGKESVGSQPLVDPTSEVFRSVVELHELVARLPIITWSGGENIVLRNLCRCIEVVADGNTTAFLSGCGVKMHRRKESPPLSLAMLSTISIRINVPLPVFFDSCEETCEKHWQSAAMHTQRSIFDIRLRPRLVTADLLRRALSESPPVSLCEVAARLGLTSTAQLYRADRVLSEQIQLRYSKYELYRLRELCERHATSTIVCDTLQKALAEKVPPSCSEIAKQLGFSGNRVLKYKHPDLCAAIEKKRAANKEMQHKVEREALTLALHEDPAPSLTELSRRSGFSSFVTLKEKFPELSKELSRRRRDQRSRHLASTREIIEKLVENPTLAWTDVTEATGQSRGTISKWLPELYSRVSSKNAERHQNERTEALETATRDVRNAVNQLLSQGIKPSSEVVGKVIPRGFCRSATMVQRILRRLRAESDEEVKPGTQAGTPI